MESFNCPSLLVKTKCQQIHFRIKICGKTYGWKVNLQSFPFWLKYAVFILGTCSQISEYGIAECKWSTSPTVRVKEYGDYTVYVYSLSWLW